jgi:hypothetical protein
MAGNLGEVNLNDVPDSDVIPAGEYRLICTKAELATSTNGKYDMVKLQWSVGSGEFQNRVVFDQMIIKTTASDANAKQAVAIGHRRLKAMCLAVGVDKPNDTADFVGKKCNAAVIIAKSDEYGDRNEVRKYKPANNAPQPASGTATGKGEW